MWLGEQITERGIGNGMSLIIYAGIVVGLPSAVITTFDQLRTGQMGLIRLVLLHRRDGVRHRRHHLRGTGQPSHYRAVREARCRPAHVRRGEHAHSVESEHRRRHPGHLRLVDSGVPGDDRADVRERPDALDDARHGSTDDGHAAVQPAVHQPDHLLRVLLHRHHLQPG